jgi:uncharacterized protein
MARKFIRRWIPSPEAMRSRRTLRWLGPLLERPWLWQLNRRSVAAGVGLGVFCGFMLPGLQIVLAALVALIIRANLPVAVASTLVSNPFTYAPIFVLAYRVGAMILGETVDEAQAAALEAETIEAGVVEVTALTKGWVERFAAVGKPLLLGLFTFATIGGIFSYFLTLALWRLGVVMRMRHRNRRIQARIGSRQLPGKPPA